MKLLSKLTLLAIGVSVLPLGIAGYSSLYIGQGALRNALRENELTVAKQVAGYAESHVDNQLSILRVDAKIFDLTRSSANESPSSEALLKFLQLVYHQSDDFCAVAMFDEHGTLIGQPAYLENPNRYDALKGHEPMRPTDVEGVGLMAPLGAALGAGEGMGPIFLGGPMRLPHVVLAVAFDPKLGGGRRILAAEVSLQRLGNYVASLGNADTEVALTDGRARLIASSAHGGVGSLGTIRLPGAREGEAPSGPIVADYVRDGRRLIGAFAPVPRWGMGALVDKTVDAALLPVNQITWATLIWIAVAALIGSIAARIFARRLSDRVAALVVGSRQIGAGQLEARIEPAAPDELGELAVAFNQMATGLEAARQKITQQTDEIKAWNQTLERRVEDKTTELRQAQDLLFRSRSLSALGELGAGVAHEINNPLTGALGIVQLLIADLPAGHPARPLLQDLESEALRIRKIVQNMLRLAQRQSGHDTTPVDLARTLDDAVELCGPSDMAAAGITVLRKYGTTPAVRGSATQLQESFIQIIQNARSAMKKGGTLTLETSQIEDKVVRVRIGDSGSGISAEHLPRIFDPFFTTKGDRSGTGLGLSFVHRTVEDHGGTVTVDSSVGGGTTFTLTFPADEGRAHRP